jgi:hypothetical protein
VVIKPPRNVTDGASLIRVSFALNLLCHAVWQDIRQPDIAGSHTTTRGADGLD